MLCKKSLRARNLMAGATVGKVVKAVVDASASGNNQVDERNMSQKATRQQSASFRRTSASERRARTGIVATEHCAARGGVIASRAKYTGAGVRVGAEA
jgi:predicted neutral ceramidase superfamily lipid hydrolase